MSKPPSSSKQLPFSSHRSVSVRQQQQQLGPPSPRLRRSTTAYHGSTTQEAAPVEIGSTGPISTLVGRDALASRVGANAEPVSKQNVVDFHIWHNRLWLILPNASKKLNAEKKTSKSTTLQAVDNHQRENRVPKWKRVLRKLKGRSNNGKLKSEQRINSDSLQNPSEKSTLDRCSSVSLSNSSKANSAQVSSTGSPRNFLQTVVSPPTPIWERRNFAQIRPLDLSHLHTSRIKKAFARPMPLG